MTGRDIVSTWPREPAATTAGQLPTGSVVAVLGGTRGIGEAIARCLGRAGAHVVVVGRDLDAARSVAAMIAAAGGEASALVCDVTDDASVTALCVAIERDRGRLDTLVLSHGAGSTPRPLYDLDASEGSTSFDVNVLGTWRVAVQLHPLLAAQGGGRVIVLGSGMGRRAASGSGWYGIAKAATSRLVQQLALEWRPTHVAVNELIPGPVRTRLAVEDLPGGEAALERFAAETGEWLKEPDDVGPLALFLAALPPDGPSGQTFSLAARAL